jgi:AcrR family transcriptional regulator
MDPFGKRVKRSKLGDSIKRIAWDLISKHGASAVSLRAIARELRVTPPAIYNYFPSRDALVTAMIIDAFTSFGDSQLEADAAVPRGNLPARMHAIGTAYRAWALEHPQHYQLIFGTPVPGYTMPGELIMPSGARSLRALVSIIEELRVKNKLNLQELPESKPVGDAVFSLWQHYGGRADVLSVSVSVLIWSRVHGLVSLELGGHMPPFGASPEALYEYELTMIKNQFIRE